MEIIIKGGDKKSTDFKLIKNALVYFLNKLISKKNLNKIHSVRISIVQHLKEKRGDCDEILTDNKKYKIFIRLEHTPNFLTMLSTLAHECVHVSQTLNNNLFVDDDGCFFWKGESYGIAPYEEFVNHEYEKLPWETEAYDKEHNLAKSFISNYYENNR